MLAKHRAAFISVLFLAGAVIMLLSCALSWYTITSVGASPGTSDALPPPTYSDNFYLFEVVTTNPYGFNPDSGMESSSAHSYSSVQLPLTGELYFGLTGVVILSLTAALVAGFLTFKWTGSRGRRVTLLFAVLSASLALAGPLILLAAQPPIVCSDLGNQHHNTPLVPSADPATAGRDGCVGDLTGGGYVGSAGPQSSFFGSTTGGGSALTWGPAAGWYFDLGATAAIAAATWLTTWRTDNRGVHSAS
jgi:hypothetical protein